VGTYTGKLKVGKLFPKLCLSLISIFHFRLLHDELTEKIIQTGETSMKLILVLTVKNNAG
jgi:hypothetical protein